MMLQEAVDSARLVSKLGSLAACFETLIYFKGECAMPVELLVPVAIFALGVVVAIHLSGMGIDRIVEKKK